MNTSFFKSPAALHRNIQFAFVIFFVYVGWEFYNYYLWACGAAVPFSPRPPAAEAFLPLSALLAAKRFFLDGGYDPVHPAGLTVFFAAIVVSFAARKAFCGYFCPVGWLCGRLDRLGRRLGVSRTPGPVVSRLISLPKYILLGGLLWLMLGKMSLFAIEGFLFSPYNKIADTHLLRFFLEPSSTTLISLAVILAGSLIVPGFWCRGFCPYGALLGFFSFFSPLAVRRNKSNCTHCRRCTRVCPVRIPVHAAERVGSPECQGCLECVAACPEPDCLDLRAGYGKKSAPLRPWLLPLLALCLLLVCYAAARVTDNWHGKVPPPELKMYHQKHFTPQTQPRL